MKTMSTIILIAITLIAIIWIIYSGHPSISFKPFSISFERPYMPFAIAFMIGALICYSIQYQEIGYKRGYKLGHAKGQNEILKELSEIFDKNKKDDKSN